MLEKTIKNLHSILFSALIMLLLPQAYAESNQAETVPEALPELQPAPYAMDNQALGAIIEKLDPEVQGRPGYWQLQAKDITAQIITDEKADRMRIIVRVALVEGLDKDLLFRLLQANFDTALDARYAIAQDVLWSTFIHPLSSLDENEFISGFAQTLTLAQSFGDTYSSGALRFNGGDRQAAEEELYQHIIEQFKKSGQAI